jgi:hypothetical protein
MKKQNYIIIGTIVIIFSTIFYWWGLRPTFDKKECYKQAEMLRQTEVHIDNDIREIDRNIIPKNETQAEILQNKINSTRDYDKLFNDSYSACLMEKGLKE